MKKYGTKAHADQIRPQGKYEEQNEEEISMIPSVNDLLEQLLQNEMSEDKIMHDQMGQSDFKNLDEDQIMQEDNLDYSSVWDRSISQRKNTGERQWEQSNPGNETISRSTRPTRDKRPICRNGDLTLMGEVRFIAWRLRRPF